MGFQRVGLMREYHYINGEKLDEILVEMLRSDYVRLYNLQKSINFNKKIDLTEI